jgi:large subunit ribosomal protein L5
MQKRVKQIYQEQVTFKIKMQFDLQNVHKVPKIKKIVINRGIGTKGQNFKVLNFSLLELSTIAAQCGTATYARKAIASFKLRKGIPIGIVVTLRSERIYAFLDRLIHLTLPRVRDFQGLSQISFDGNGNYTLGLKDQFRFPEIQYDQITASCGINISVITSSNTDKERFFLLKRIGIPFRNYLYFRDYL